MSSPTPADPQEERRETVRQELAGIVQRVTGVAPQEVLPDRRWVADLRVDSLSMVEVLEGSAQHFGVRIADEDTRGLVRVGDLVDHLVRGGAGAR